MKRFVIISLAAVFLVSSLCVTGCKKKNEEAALPSLEGDLFFVIDPYLRAGTTVQLQPMGVTHPEGKEIGYSLVFTATDSETPEKKDTIAAEDFPVERTIPADLEDGSYYATMTAFASGYYAVSETRNFCVIDPRLNGSLTKLDIFKSTDHFVDSREAVAEEGTYYTMESNGLTWMRNNLAYTGSGAAYLNCEVMSYPIGRFYSWDEAQTACPDGWRLPTAAEWDSFGSVAGDWMADAYMLEEKMWEYWPNVRITNFTGLSVIPSGYAVRSSHNQFSGLLEYAAFWTADSDPDDPTKALYRYINANRPEVFFGSGDKASFGASVRCVK